MPTKDWFSYSIVWMDDKGFTHWDVWDHFTQEEAESLCEKEDNFKEILHVAQYPIKKKFLTKERSF